MGIDYDNQYQVDIPLTVRCFAHTAASMHVRYCSPCLHACMLRTHQSSCCMLQQMDSRMGTCASAVTERAVSQHDLTLLSPVKADAVTYGTLSSHCLPHPNPFRPTSTPTNTPFCALSQQIKAEVALMLCTCMQLIHSYLPPIPLSCMVS